MTVSLLSIPALAADLVSPSSPATFGGDAQPHVSFDPTTQQQAIFSGPLPSVYEPGVPLSVIVSWRTPTTQASSGRAILEASIVGMPLMSTLDSRLDVLQDAITVELAPDFELPPGYPDAGDRVQYAHFDFLTTGELNSVQPNQTLVFVLDRLTLDAADNHTGAIEVLGLHVVTDLFDPANFDPVIGSQLRWYHDARDFSSLTFSGSEVTGFADQTANNIDLAPNSKGPEYDAAGCGGRPALTHEDTDLEADQTLILSTSFTWFAVFCMPITDSGNDAIFEIDNVMGVDMNHATEQLRLDPETGPTTAFLAAGQKLPHVLIMWYDQPTGFFGMRIDGGSAVFSDGGGDAAASIETLYYGRGNFAHMNWSFDAMYEGVLSFDAMNDITLRLAHEFNVELTAPLVTAPIAP